MRMASLMRKAAPMAVSDDTAAVTPRQQAAANSAPKVLASCFAGSFMPSAGAAGKLFHVLAEGLRAQLDAFHHGEVREQLSGKIGDGHSGPQCKRYRLDDLTRLGGKDLSADQPPGALLGDELDEASCVEVRERARHVLDPDRT